MLTTSATGGATVRTVDESFLELICSDPDLLAAEFDGIIAAGWPRRPNERSGRGTPGGHRDSDAARRDADPAGEPVTRRRHPGIGGWARQRSPPLRYPTHNSQEGR